MAGGRRSVMIRGRGSPVLFALLAVLGPALAGFDGSGELPTGEPRWPSLGGGFRRDGLSRDAGPATGEVRWTFETDGAVVGSVTVGSAGRVHVACEDGKLYTLDSDGKPLWVYDANCPLLSAPTVGPDGSLYVGGRDGRLFAVRLDGRPLWSCKMGGAIYSSPASGADGRVFVASTDGTLLALDRHTGSELWRHTTRGPGRLPQGAIFASPSIGADGTLYIAGLYDPNFYALDPADGRVKWACRFPAASTDPSAGGWPFTSPVVAPDGTIYQTLLYDRHLYAIEPATGKIRWSVELPDPSPPGDQDPIVPSGGGWSEPVLGPDGTIYVCLDGPYIHAVDPAGTVKWTRPFGEVGGFTMAVDKTGTVYAASDDGVLYVVAADGSEIARWQLDGRPACPVIAAEGLLILADSREYSFLKENPKNRIRAIGARTVED
jgi:outer membrane protein assembly factor BamB